MHLARIRIVGFRNLKDVQIELEPGLNVFVGANNVGKTNIFDALRLALGSAAASDGSYVQLDRDDFYRETRTEDPANNIRVSLTFEDLSVPQMAHFHELIEPDLADIAESKATLHVEAVWNPARHRATLQRWGGSEKRERASISMETLQALPITFLPALRDAEAALTPGYGNRVAQLFRDRIKRTAGDTSEAEMLTIFTTANESLVDLDVVKDVTKEFSGYVRSMSGIDFVDPIITAAPPEIHRILRSLSVALESGPVPDIGGCGLGYNNLLYVGTVLTHLGHFGDGDQPLLVVEEPEAHLHPQLVQLLAVQLGKDSGKVQTLVSSHSTAFVSSIDPRQVRPVFRDSDSNVRIGSLANVGLDAKEARQLQRMMDMTRAALFFARGVILVEGVSEALLVPALAKRIGVDLRAAHVSVVPIAGVAFETFNKVLSEEGLRTRVAIVTDTDPPLVKKKGKKELPWNQITFEEDGGAPKPSARVIKLKKAFSDHDSVRVFTSKVTLEYDLADAAAGNPGAMAEVWESVFKGTPGTFSTKKLAKLTDHNERTLATWRGICLANTTGGKAEFAHRLVEHLGDEKNEFAVPEYLEDAIRFVTEADDE